MSIFKIKHNRSISFNTYAPKFFLKINCYVKNEMRLFTKYRSFLYNIPIDDLENQIIRTLGWGFDNKRGKFRSELKLAFVPIYFFAYYGMLFYILIFSKIRLSKKFFKFLVIDVHKNSEIKRIENLLESFGRENVLILSYDRKSKSNNYNILIQKDLRNYDFIITLKIILYELLFGIFINIFICIYLRYNFFFVLSRFQKTNIEFSSIFKNYNSDFLYFERYIKIQPIVKPIYNKYGGKLLSTSQKSILANDQTSFCYNFDVIFTLGNKSMKRSKLFNSKIRDFVPIGSLFKYQNFSKNYNNSVEQSSVKSFDILFLGGNIMFADFFENHSDFKKNYYECLKWLLEINKIFSKYSIGIKHHKNAQQDIIEKNIFEGSNIEIIDNQLDTYELIENSKICITYASTIGYEAMEMGKPCIFLDPNYTNYFLPNSGVNKLTDKLRARNFTEFSQILKMIYKKEFNLNDYHESLKEVIIDEQEPQEIMFNYFKNK